MPTASRVATPRLAGLGLIAVIAAPAPALVVQGLDTAVPASVAAAFGRWGNNAAAIAVAPNWVLTTRHQDTLSAPNRTVTFGNQSYTALANDPASVVNLSSDLRLVRIEDTAGNDANLTATLQAYDGPPLTAGAAVTLGGFGPGIGASEADGFDYLGNENNNNPLRFGTNLFEGFTTINNPGDRFNGLGVLVADFDELGTPGATASEATGGPGDSGGAWLIEINGVFQIAGLTHGISEQLDDPSTPNVNEAALADAFFGQGLFASDATAFAATINSIPEPATAALLAAALPLLSMRRRR